MRKLPTHLVATLAAAASLLALISVARATEIKRVDLAPPQASSSPYVSIADLLTSDPPHQI